MKTLLAACVTFGIVTVAALPQAHADVRFGPPGVRVDIGPHHERDWHHRYWAHRQWEHRRWEAYRERCYYRGC
jgi:hypothetical protein